MTDGMSGRSKILLAGIVAAGVVLRMIAVRALPPTDDAFITFRYAENLASGHGFVYNLGSRVLGTTTPLFTLLLVPFAAAGASLEMSAAVLSILCDAGLAVVVTLLLRRGLGDAVALLAALFTSLSYIAVTSTSYGMETQLFCLLVVGALFLQTTSRRTPAAVLAALAVLTRPEGALVAGIVVVSTLTEAVRGRLGAALRQVAVMAAVAAPWFVFAALYFGSPVPNSVLAKAFQDSISARQWAEFFVLRNPVVVLLWCGAAVGVGVGVRVRSRAVLLLGAWAAAYLVFFLGGRPPFLGAWYMQPAAMPAVILAAVGAGWVVARVLRGELRGAGAVALLWVALTAVVLPRSLETQAWYARAVEMVYRPLAEWARTETAAGAVIHAPDIGYLGYYSGRTISDASALVTPELRKHRAAHPDDPNWDVSYILERRPDFVVLPIKGRIYERFRQSEFPLHYEPIKRFQIEGLSDLHPPADIVRRYAEDPRYMADFLVYARR